VKPETKEKLKFGGWGLVCGAIISMIIGFGWGGWTTAMTTQKMTDDAILARQSAICVAQFIKQTNYADKFKEFEKVDSWKRSDFIKAGGWDKMPGQTDADWGVAQACSEGLELLIKE
jgi:hypothetical protein